MKRKLGRNYKFEDSMMVNDATFSDYLNRFKRIALSIFEWVNLPKSMNEEFLEKCLYYTGQASFLIYNKSLIKHNVEKSIFLFLFYCHCI